MKDNVIGQINAAGTIFQLLRNEKKMLGLRWSYEIIIKVMIKGRIKNVWIAKGIDLDTATQAFNEIANHNKTSVILY